MWTTAVATTCTITGLPSNTALTITGEVATDSYVGVLSGAFGGTSKTLYDTTVSAVVTNFDGSVVTIQFTPSSAAPVADAGSAVYELYDETDLVNPIAPQAACTWSDANVNTVTCTYLTSVRYFRARVASAANQGEFNSAFGATTTGISRTVVRTGGLLSALTVSGTFLSAGDSFTVEGVTPGGSCQGISVTGWTVTILSSSFSEHGIVVSVCGVLLFFFCSVSWIVLIDLLFVSSLACWLTPS